MPSQGLLVAMNWLEARADIVKLETPCFKSANCTFEWLLQPIRSLGPFNLAVTTHSSGSRRPAHTEGSSPSTRPSEESPSGARRVGTLLPAPILRSPAACCPPPAPRLCLPPVPRRQCHAPQHHRLLPSPGDDACPSSSSALCLPGREIGDDAVIYHGFCNSIPGHTTRAPP
jgi:hypothetical protein